MKKAVFLFLAVMIIVGFTIKDSSAQTQRCWKVGGFSDIIKVSLVDTGFGNKLVTGIWMQSSSGVGYLLPVVGSLVKHANGVDYRLNLQATNNTDSFGGFDDCIMDVTLSKTTTPKWQGDGIYSCGAGGYPGGSTGTLTRVNCTTFVPLSGIAANSSEKAAGE